MLSSKQKKTLLKTEKMEFEIETLLTKCVGHNLNRPGWVNVYVTPDLPTLE